MIGRPCFVGLAADNKCAWRDSEPKMDRRERIETRVATKKKKKSRHIDAGEEKVHVRYGRVLLTTWKTKILLKARCNALFGTYLE